MSTTKCFKKFSYVKVGSTFVIIALLMTLVLLIFNNSSNRSNSNAVSHQHEHQELHKRTLKSLVTSFLLGKFNETWKCIFSNTIIYVVAKKIRTIWLWSCSLLAIHMLLAVSSQIKCFPKILTHSTPRTPRSLFVCSHDDAILLLIFCRVSSHIFLFFQ